jgi:hypothetical protein
MTEGNAMSTTMTRPATSPSELTGLSAAVYTIVSAEHAMWTGPGDSEGTAKPAARETDFFDKGFCRGAAVALALRDYPVETPEMTTKRAELAAQEVFERWAGEIAPRADWPAVIDRVILAHRAHSPSARCMENEGYIGLEEALNELECVFGAPAKEGTQPNDRAIIQDGRIHRHEDDRGGDEEDVTNATGEPESVASSSGSVPLPLEDIAAIDRTLQGHLLDMGFGEDSSLEEFLGIGTQPSPIAFEALGSKVAVIARVLKALERREYPLDRESRDLLAALIQEAEKDTADPLDEQDKMLAAARLEWLRLAEGVVARCADERTRETTTEGGE